MEPAVQRFATVFAQLQQQRRLADYDPHSRYSREQVLYLIDAAENGNRRSDEHVLLISRRPLATLVLLRDR